MASPYGGGGGERGVQRFSGAVGTIEVDDFKKEFTMWCELQKSRNTNFHPLHGMEGFVRLFGGCSVGGLRGV
jgi:hypothetical protein